MWTLTVNGIDVYHLISWFIIYSFLGWAWETCYVSFKEGDYINRGFINGPLCTIYGFGAISVYLILWPIEQNLLLLFLGGIFVSTLLEYITAVLMECIFHTTWWDYSDKKLNFQGRICLGASVGWGVFTVILFRVLHPAVSRFVNLYPVYIGKVCICIIGVIYLCDFSYSALSAFRLRERIPVWEHQLEKKQVELMLKVNSKLNSMGLPDITLENMRERLEDIDFIRNMYERRLSIREDISRELKSYKKSLSTKIGHNTRRFFKSYPHLNRGYRLHHKNDKNISIPDAYKKGGNT